MNTFDFPMKLKNCDNWIIYSAAMYLGSKLWYSADLKYPEKTN